MRERKKESGRKDYEDVSTNDYKDSSIKLKNSQDTGDKKQNKGCKKKLR